jgi:hypothetical protein
MSVAIDRRAVRTLLGPVGIFLVARAVIRVMTDFRFGGLTVGGADLRQDAQDQATGEHHRREPAEGPDHAGSVTPISAPSNAISSIEALRCA